MAKVESATKADYDAKLNLLEKERDNSPAEIRKKYPSAGATSGAPKQAAVAAKPNWLVADF